MGILGSYTDWLLKNSRSDWNKLLWDYTADINSKILFFFFFKFCSIMPVKGSGPRRPLELSPGPGSGSANLPRRAPSAPASPTAAIKPLHFLQINSESTKTLLLTIGLVWVELNGLFLCSFSQEFPNMKFPISTCPRGCSHPEALYPHGCLQPFQPRQRMDACAAQGIAATNLLLICYK